MLGLGERDRRAGAAYPVAGSAASARDASRGCPDRWSHCRNRRAIASQPRCLGQRTRCRATRCGSPSRCAFHASASSVAAGVTAPDSQPAEQCQRRAANDRLIGDRPPGLSRYFVPRAAGEVERGPGQVQVAQEAEELRLVSQLDGTGSSGPASSSRRSPMDATSTYARQACSTYRRPGDGRASSTIGRPAAHPAASS
jgi:hypothetical protein